MSISTGLGTFLGSKQALYPEEQVRGSFHPHQRSTPPDPIQVKDQTDFKFIRGLSAPKENILDTVVDILNDKMVANIDGRLFLPQGTLNKFFDEYAMFRLLRDLPQPCISATGIIEGTSFLLQSHKIFAILILSGLLQFFQMMVNELGISDECLPMPDLDFLTGSSLMIGNKNAEHLENWKLVTKLFGRKAFIRMFSRSNGVYLPLFSKLGITLSTTRLAKTTYCLLFEVSHARLG